MAGQSFIDIYRSMLKMEWEKDISVHCLYHHFLLHANMYPISFKSFEIPAGGMLVQLDQLAKDTGLTQNQVRLALKKLTDSHKITITVLHRVGSLVTIADWEAYTNEITLKPQQNHTKTTTKSESQDTENNEDTNLTDVQTTLKPQQNHTKTTTKEEQENKETSPTPLKENKEKEEDTLSRTHVTDSDDSQQMLFSFDDMTYKTTEEKPPKTSNHKSKNQKLTYNKQTHKIEGITDEDKAKWQQRYPYLDIDAEIENEEEYLAHPKRHYTDIRRTFENHLKSQPYPSPSSADEVMRIGMERKLDITLEMATHFFNKHQASGWKDEHWKPILDWRCLLENFVASWTQNHYGQNQQMNASATEQDEDSKPWWSKLSPP